MDVAGENISIMIQLHMYTSKIMMNELKVLQRSKEKKIERKD
jgi:hypothetical protein